jgi:hypothetical protein
MGEVIGRCRNLRPRNSPNLTCILRFNSNNGDGSRSLDCENCTYNPLENPGCGRYRPQFFYVVEVVDEEKTPPPGFEPGSRP